MRTPAATLALVLLTSLLAGCLDHSFFGANPAPTPLGSALPPPAPHAEFIGSDPLPRLSLTRGSRPSPAHPQPAAPGSPLATPPPAGTEL